MKKLYAGKDDIVSVYKFMELCGLHCDIKDNVKVSHEIMLRKLALRKRAFPKNITMPKKIWLKSIETEDLKTGSVILVEDDYKQVIGYKLPQKSIVEYVSKGEMKRRRYRIMALPDKKYVTINGKKGTSGYIKYLEKKKKITQEIVALVEEAKIMEAKAHEEANRMYEEATGTKPYVKKKELGK